MLNNPVNKNYRRKMTLIDEIKKCYGENCIGESTKNFDKQNIIIFTHNDNEIILYFHFSNEIGFFGCDVGYVDRIASYISDNPSKKVYSFVYLMLNDDETGKVNFAIPVFFIKNHGSEISKTEDKQYYRFNILYKNGIYWLRLKNNPPEDLSNFISGIQDITSDNLMNRHDKEKEVFVNKADAQRALLIKFGKL